MSSFLYFVPGATSPKQAEQGLDAAGAAHATERHPQYNQVTGGPPFGGPGYLVGSGTNYLLKPDEQEWRKAPVLVDPYDGAGYWIGWEKDAPPGPEDLAREIQLAGHLVELGDGKNWLVPVARRYADSPEGLAWKNALSTVRRLKPDGSGWEEGPVRAAHARLWQHAERIAAIYCAVAAEESSDQSPASRAGFTYDEEMEAIVEILAINYRVGAVEISARGLITSDCIVSVLNAVIDVPGMVALLSKKARAPGGAVTSPGEGV